MPFSISHILNFDDEIAWCKSLPNYVAFLQYLHVLGWGSSGVFA